MGNERRSQGFTLAELLVVVAIIGVLAAVSIPVFSGQLEKAREATDMANVRSAYSEVLSDAITENQASGSTYDAASNRYWKTVQLKQKQNGWQSANVNIAGITPDDKVRWQGQTRADGTCEVIFDANTQGVILNWSGYTVKMDYQWRFVDDNTKNKITLGKRQSNWPASAIPNAIDAKINANQSLVVKAITDASPTLKAALNAGYKYEIGFFVTKSDGTVIVNHGYEYLSGSETSTYLITTDENALSKEEEGNGDKKVWTDVSVNAGDDVKVNVQLFKVYESHSKPIDITAEEAAELSKLISFDTGSE